MSPEAKEIQKQMALTRAFLKSMQLTDEQVTAIVEAHGETVDALKAKNSDLQKKLEEAKEVADKSEKSDGEYKSKYEKEKADFEEYKANQKKSEETSKKKSAYENLLRQAGIKEKAISQILALTKVDDLKLSEDGKLDGAENLTKSIKSDWSEFITKEQTKGAKVENPPANNGGDGMTKEQIMSIKDSVQRRQAIKDHIELFGYK